MKHQVAATFICLICFISMQQAFCDGISETSSIRGNWTCKCFSSSYQENQSVTHSTNCSTSCSCSPDAGRIGFWTCICAADGFPKVAADSNCFTSCNCSSGLLPELPSSRRHISSNVVIIILLSCVIITTLAFLTSVICYLSRRKNYHFQPPIFSLDSQMSCNSFTNLISHKSSSIPDSKDIIIRSPVNNTKGCFYMKSCLYRTRTRNMCGIIIQFSYSELENATNKFSSSNLVGLGGSSFVYRGELNDGRTVAVKRLNVQGGPDVDYLFLTEIQLLSRLHHCHVVPLLGYCTESRGKHTERLLVYEYMPKGNLRDCLDVSSGETMDWGTRVSIALGAARGLEYLHEAAAPRILHRDVKSTNILLDKDSRAKITDLGMATRLKGDDLPSYPSSPARMQGTFGYFAPEYAIAGRASLKSDVFSFGVVLLELITGQHPIVKSASKGEESLVIWAASRLQNSRRFIKELPDPNLNGVFPEEEMQIMAYLAKECLLLDPDARPTMTEVVQVLSDIAPNKSRRNNTSANIFQGRIHSEVSSIDVVKLRQSPLDIDHSLYADNNGIQDVVSSEYMEKLVVLTSKGRNLQASDDDIVDLTEPRYESF